MLDHNKLYIATIKNAAVRNTQVYYGANESAPHDSDDWRDCDAPIFLNVCFVNNPTEKALEMAKETIAKNAGVLPCFVELEPLVKHGDANHND